MILDNGTIQVQTIVGGGLVDGIPQSGVAEWSEPIPCIYCSKHS